MTNPSTRLSHREDSMQQNAPASPAGGDFAHLASGLTGQPDNEPNLVSGLIAAHDLAHGPTEAAVQVQLERTLRKAGVERIFVNAGDRFDPATHREVDTANIVDPIEDQNLIGRVEREVRPGWLSGGRVLRAVDVVVWTG